MRSSRYGQSDSFDPGSNEVPANNTCRQKEQKVATKTAVGGEQGKRSTMNRLLAAARIEFARKGLAGARVEAIAIDAGVTNQLVYH